MNGKPKARPTMVNPRRGIPSIGARELLPKTITPKGIGKPSRKELMVVKGKAAILKEYEKSISPKGMAKTNAQQTKAQDALMVKRYGKKK